MMPSSRFGARPFSRRPKKSPSPAEPIPSVARRNAALRKSTSNFEGAPYRGLEQDPETTSHWAQLPRKGTNVMQFLSNGRYLGVVVDGKITHYGRNS